MTYVNTYYELCERVPLIVQNVNEIV